MNEHKINELKKAVIILRKSGMEDTEPYNVLLRRIVFLYDCDMKRDLDDYRLQGGTA